LTTSIDEFLTRRATADVVLGQKPNGEDAVIRVTFDPTKLNPATDEKIQRGVERQDTKIVARVIKDVVYEWDFTGPFSADVPVLDEDGNVQVDADGDEMTELKLLVQPGEVIPITVDVLRWMSHATLIAIWRAINLANRPNEMTSAE
jgi:hypothetical protein